MAQPTATTPTISGIFLAYSEPRDIDEGQASDLRRTRAAVSLFFARRASLHLRLQARVFADFRHKRFTSYRLLTLLAARPPTQSARQPRPQERHRGQSDRFSTPTCSGARTVTAHSDSWEADRREQGPLAGTGQCGGRLGRCRPVIQGVPAGRTLCGSPRAGYGRECQLTRSPGSRH